MVFKKLLVVTESPAGTLANALCIASDRGPPQPQLPNPHRNLGAKGLGFGLGSEHQQSFNDASLVSLGAARMYNKKNWTIWEMLIVNR